MTPTATLEAARTWPLDDRLELIFDLWDQIVDSGWKPDATAELTEELERRVAAHEADPSRVLTWDQVVAHVKRPRS